MIRSRAARDRRGLTILEALLAAAILAATAVALAPVVRQVLAESNPPPAPFSLAEFTRFVDRSFAQIAPDQVEEETELQWETDSAVRSVRVAWAAGAEPDRGWLVFSCEAAVVLRWRHVPSVEQDEEVAE